MLESVPIEKPYRNAGVLLSLLLVCLFFGFYKTYFGVAPRYFFSISKWVHLHAALGVLWTVLLIAQPILIGRERVRIHRLLGKVSYFLMPAFLLSAVPMLFFVWLRGDPLILFASLSDAALLLLFYCLAIVYRKKTALHGRFMLATGLVLLDPSLGRMAVNFLGLSPDWGNHLPFLTIDLILLALIFFDVRSGRQFKPFLFALTCFGIYETAAYALNHKIQNGLKNLPNNSYSMDYKRLDFAEVDTHIDLWAAQPETFSREMGADTARVDGVFVVTCQKIPFLHFNIALDMGVVKPVTERQLDTILAHFKKNHAPRVFLHSSPMAEPAELPDWLVSRGMRQVGSWHRIGRTNEPLGEALPLSKQYKVETVDTTNAVAWADFIDQVYGMPTKPWLLELVGRPGWTQVIARDETGKIVAARSMKINPDHSAYFCIDAPVPGIMTQNFEADYVLARRLLEIGLENGVQLFAGDIEKTAPLQDTPAYGFWASLGFKVAYEKKTFSF